MEKAISAADAKGKFSQLLRDVRAGQSYVVTNHGKPVARIVPLREHRGVRATARIRLLSRLESEHLTGIGTWKREYLHEE